MNNINLEDFYIIEDYEMMWTKIPWWFEEKITSKIRQWYFIIRDKKHERIILTKPIVDTATFDNF